MIPMSEPGTDAKNLEDAFRFTEAFLPISSGGSPGLCRRLIHGPRAKDVGKRIEAFKSVYDELGYRTAKGIWRPLIDRRHFAVTAQDARVSFKNHR